MKEGENERVGVIIKVDPYCPLSRGSLHVMNVKGHKPKALPLTLALPQDQREREKRRKMA